MSEETQEQEGTWSGLKKTIIGTISTIVLGAGTWVGTTLFGGSEDKAEPAPVQQAAPVINLNLQNNNTQTQAAGGTTKVVERVVEKPAAQPVPAPKPKEFTEEPKW
jgi:hypothetical protein